MRKYKTAELKDIRILRDSSYANRLFANNYSAVNSFLYRNKYSSEIAVEDGWIFERYIKDGIHCYSFPHNINGNYTTVKEKLLFIAEESRQQYGNFVLMNITKEEKDMTLELFPDALVQEARESSDYIYLTESLCLLSGKKLSRKRNHLHQFYKKHPDCRYETLDKGNLSLIKQLEHSWITERESCENDSTLLTDLYIEQKMIEEALADFDTLNVDAGLSGGIAFAKDNPFAFCLYSCLNKDVTDIHFEKCLSSFANDGGYAFINNEEAKSIKTKYINREEDLGIEGLRKAKLSYFPEIILPKFNIVMEF